MRLVIFACLFKQRNRLRLTGTHTFLVFFAFLCVAGIPLSAADLPKAYIAPFTVKGEATSLEAEVFEEIFSSRLITTKTLILLPRTTHAPERTHEPEIADVIEDARERDAAYVFTGKVMRVAGSYVITLQAIDTVTSNYVGSAVAQFASIEEATSAISQAVETLIFGGAPLPPDANNDNFLTNFVFVSGGTFIMGSEEGEIDETPTREITLSPFFISPYEVAYGLWYTVFEQARDLGYAFENKGSAGSTGEGEPTEPVTKVSWYDAIKWCNALSELLGKTPCYYIDSNRTTVYRKGEHDVSADDVLWDADGYRLPTEAEWEYACRAGTTNTYFFGNTIDRAYLWYHDNAEGKTHPVAEKQANPLGLYDVLGNAWEWCFDRYAPNYDTNDVSLDPNGPTNGEYRVLRGGAYNVGAYVTTTYRSRVAPAEAWDNFGFRIVTSPREETQTNTTNRAE